MKIAAFDGKTCRILGERIEATLKELGAEFGVSIVYKGGAYNGGTCTIKVDASVIAADGTIVTKEAQAFKALATFYKMKPDDLGRKFRSGGREFTITGLAPKSSVRPILASTGGKTFKFAAEDIVRLWAKP